MVAQITLGGNSILFDPNYGAVITGRDKDGKLVGPTPAQLDKDGKPIPPTVEDALLLGFQNQSLAYVATVKDGGLRNFANPGQNPIMAPSLLFALQPITATTAQSL